jgi:hypothetical protein
MAEYPRAHAPNVAIAASFMSALQLSSDTLEIAVIAELHDRFPAANRPLRELL